MKHCQLCDTLESCRIPEELGRLKRVHKAISARGGHPWLEARIEQYMAVDVCLSSLFGLDDLHAKAALIEATHARVGSTPYPHIPHQSVALEITLRRHLNVNA